MMDLVERLGKALSDRYRIERELGAGGMATVYQARDLKHDRQVAIKVLRPDLATALGPQRFLQEIKIAANLRHPHILPLYDSGESDGLLFYVMPYEEGQSLRERLERHGELSITEAVRILRDVVEALAHAHRHGVVHRDIKPANVMLAERHALVADFGVAKAVSEAADSERLTTEGVALGTPTYMAPEQAAAEPIVDHRADIYAVGILAYELLTGRPPFHGTSPQQILSAHLTTNPDPVTRHRETVPPALETLVLKCLEKRAADRWQSAEEILPQLEALATPSGGVTPAGLAPSGTAGRRWKAAAVAAATVAALAVAGWFWLSPGSEEPELTPNRVLVLPFLNRTGDASFDQVGALTADRLSEGLTALTGVIEPVPTVQAMQFLQGGMEGTADPGAGTVGLAAATGAGTVISGSYYRQGDSLEFQAQVVNTVDDAILGAVEPVRGAIQDPSQAIERLRERVAGILAARFDPLMRVEIPASERPPSFEVMGAYSSGLRAFLEGDYSAAIGFFERASQLDTTYTRASVLAIASYSNLGQLAVAESLALEALGSPERLGHYDRLRTEYLLGSIQGDRVAAYRAARAAAALVPGGTIHYGTMGAAVAVNRPREALEIGESLRIPAGLRGVPVFYYDGLASAHHLLGQHEEELEVAKRGREEWPSHLMTLWYEVRALAGLGEMDELRAGIEESLILPTERGWTPGDVIRLAARELVAHGHPDEAGNVLRRAYEWHDSRSAEDAESQSGRFDLALTLYLDRRLEEAEELFSDLAAESPENINFLGYLGAIAARRGDRGTADEVAVKLREVERPYTRGRHTLWRARIASLLGEKEAAVALLREALAQGRSYGPEELHSELDFQPLWDFPPYQELMRPKG